MPPQPELFVGEIAALDGQAPPVLDARASRSILATVEAALESARTGQPVVVA